ncbi:MAG: autotransporter assembly complex protein TamA [Magnetospiraceae bacterium]
MRFLPALLLLLLTACAGNGADTGPEDPFADVPGIPYETDVTGAPTEDFQSLLDKSLRLYLLAEKPPRSKARLARRAESDEAVIKKILRSEGYYKGTTGIEITELPPPEEEDAEAPRFRVTLAIDAGPQFTLEQMRVETPPLKGGLTLPSAAAFGLPPGAPARAADIVAVESATVEWLTQHGYPYAQPIDRRAVADLEANTLAVTSNLNLGPRVAYGTLRVEGLTSVQEEYVRTYLPWEEGEVYTAEALAAMQRRLLQTGLFEFVAVRHGEPRELDRSGEVPRVPVLVTTEEAPHQTIGGGLRYSTDVGPGGRAFYEHRNLFGANETTRVELLASLEAQSIEVTYRKPQFLRDRQDLVAGVGLVREEADAYEGVVLSTNLGLERQLTTQLTIGLGVTTEWAAIEQDGVDKTSYLIGFPLTATYDATDDLLNPTRGIRASSSVIPYGGMLEDAFTGFLVFDNQASTYLALDDELNYILALRGRLGSIFGVPRDDIPLTRRLYSGGGGSVRGYESRFIGPLDADGDPEGGRSVMEMGVELRVRFLDDFGIVPFIDAGTVSDQMFPDFDSGVQVAAGLGFRYYTAIGPMRLDIAVPLNPRDEDGAFQFYIAVGQAF